MNRNQVRDLQRDLNRFSGKYLAKFPKLQVDGKRGHATNRRIQSAKWYLGYGGNAQRSSRVTDEFRERLARPKSPDVMPREMLEAGADRRKRQRKRAAQAPSSGVAHFDGRPVAAWLVPYLEWAREHGWTGTLVSGWRDPEHSEELCERMCGAPSCPGRCAGKASNHSGSVKPNGALDVSDFARFGQLMQRCPHEPRIFNALGRQDPVHFSASGR